jgi:hypothetical protein
VVGTLVGNRVPFIRYQPPTPFYQVLHGIVHLVLRPGKGLVAFPFMALQTISKTCN